MYQETSEPAVPAWASTTVLPPAACMPEQCSVTVITSDVTVADRLLLVSWPGDSLVLLWFRYTDTDHIEINRLLYS